MGNQKGYMRNYDSLKWNGKVSRKWKLKLLGRKKSKKAIKEENRMFTLFPIGFPSCHVCGCSYLFYFGHNVEYPEIWNEYKCRRCKTIVAYEDNCPLTFVLLEEEEAV